LQGQGVVDWLRRQGRKWATPDQITLLLDDSPPAKETAQKLGLPEENDFNDSMFGTNGQGVFVNRLIPESIVGGGVEGVGTIINRANELATGERGGKGKAHLIDLQNQYEDAVGPWSKVKHALAAVSRFREAGAQVTRMEDGDEGDIEESEGEAAGGVSIEESDEEDNIEESEATDAASLDAGEWAQNEEEDSSMLSEEEDNIEDWRGDARDGAIWRAAEEADATDAAAAALDAGEWSQNEEDRSPQDKPLTFDLSLGESGHEGMGVPDASKGSASSKRTGFSRAANTDPTGSRKLVRAQTTLSAKSLKPLPRKLTAAARGLEALKKLNLSSNKETETRGGSHRCQPCSTKKPKSPKKKSIKKKKSKKKTKRKYIKKSPKYSTKKSLKKKSFKKGSRKKTLRKKSKRKSKK
jgi:hypothetical protein